MPDTLGGTKATEAAITPGGPSADSSEYPVLGGRADRLPAFI
jgi:hypothetical protein